MFVSSANSRSPQNPPLLPNQEWPISISPNKLGMHFTKLGQVCQLLQDFLDQQNESLSQGLENSNSQDTRGLYTTTQGWTQAGTKAG